MSDAVIASMITGGLALLGVVFSVIVSSRATMNKVTTTLEKSQAVTDTKLEGLTREVREHNNFAKRMPVLEEKMDVANHRISDLEEDVKELRKKE
jgi:hypothetical protein